MVLEQLEMLENIFSLLEETSMDRKSTEREILVILSAPTGRWKM
jgi:hypothetical protein